MFCSSKAGDIFLMLIYNVTVLKTCYEINSTCSCKKTALKSNDSISLGDRLIYKEYS